MKMIVALTPRLFLRWVTLLGLLGLLPQGASAKSFKKRPLPRCEPVCESLRRDSERNQQLMSQLLEVQSSDLELLKSLGLAKSPERPVAKANLKLAALRIKAAKKQKKEIDQKMKRHHCHGCQPGP